MPVIYIATTPGLQKNFMDEVFQYLKDSGKGNFQITFLEELTNQEMKELKRSVYKPDDTMAFPNPEFVRMANHLREMKKGIKKDDYVVLYTDLSDTKRWWSATKDKDIFITTNLWSIIFAEKASIACAHQVWENILQSQLGISYQDVQRGVKNIHRITRGCQLDFCEKKREVEAKIASAYICGDCMSLASERKADRKTIAKLKTALAFLAEKFTTFIEPPVQLSIDQAGQVFIGAEKVEMDPAERMVYIFYLLQTEPLATKEFFKPSRRSEFELLLRNIANVVPVIEPERTIENVLDRESGNLSSCLSRIRTKIRKADALNWGYYSIECYTNDELMDIGRIKPHVEVRGGRKIGKYYIILAPALRSIHERFLIMAPQRQP